MKPVVFQRLSMSIFFNLGHKNHDIYQITSTGNTGLYVHVPVCMNDGVKLVFETKYEHDNLTMLWVACQNLGTRV